MATIGTVEGVLKLRDEFSAALKRAETQLGATAATLNRTTTAVPKLDASFGSLGNRLDDIGRSARMTDADFEAIDARLAAAGIGLDDMSTKAGRAAGELDDLGSSTGVAGGELIAFTKSAAGAALVLGIVAAGAAQARKELDSIGESLISIDPELEPVVEGVRQLGADLKAVALTGFLGVISVQLRKMAADAEEARAALAKLPKILATPLPETFYARQLREAEKAADALERSLQKAFDAALLPETKARIADLQGQLKGLDQQSKVSTDRLRDLREEHEASLRAIRERAKDEENFAETMQMVTQEAQDQADSWRELNATMDRFNLDALADQANRFSAAMAEIFPEQTELQRLEGLRDILEEMADLKVISPEQFTEGMDVLDQKVRDIGKSTSDLAVQWVRVAQEAVGAMSGLDSGTQQAIQAVLNLVVAFIALEAAIKAGEAASGWIGLISAAIGAIVALSGGGKTVKGESPSLDFSGGIFDEAQKAEIRDQLGMDIVDALAGVDFASFIFEQLIEFERQWAEQVGSLISTIGLTADAMAASFEVVARTHIFEDKVTQTWRVMFDGIETTFTSAADAAAFAMRETLRNIDLSGIDEAVRQIVENVDIPVDLFADAVERVQGLADAASMSLDGISALELEIQRLPSVMDALRLELEQLGLSASQVTRLVGGQLVASFQAWRQQITGEELSVEQRRAIAEAQRQLFNAELELQIARLEAEKAALLAEAGIAQAEVQLHSNVINAQSRFVSARGDLANAELGVMGGFVQAGAAIVRSGVELIGDTSRALGDALGSLPEEIRKQVEAIQKVIDALKKIGTIGPGDIRIPGISTGGVGGTGGGAGPAGPSPENRIGELINALLREVEAQQDLVDALRDTLGGLETFIRDLRLTGPSPLTPGQQAEQLRKQLREVAAQAEMGDLEAIREFQRIAQALQQVGAEAFGTAGSGFQALLREIEFLGGDILTEGNVTLERQEDILSDIRGEFGDLLEVGRGLHDLSEEEIRAIREEGVDTRSSINRDLQEQGTITRRELQQLRQELRALGRILADRAA